MLNKIILMGRLTRDPELRYTNSSVPVTSFSLACERDFKESGERKTDFINCIAWRQTGEFVSQYFVKGRMAVVAGRLQIREYTDRDGNHRTAAEVVADSVYFGDSKRDSDTSERSYTPPPSSAASSQPGNYAAAPSGFQQGVFVDMDEDDGELPF